VWAIDIAGTSRRKWTIDFGLMSLDQAAEYEMPFEYVRERVYPACAKNRRATYVEKWWQYAEPRPGMRQALKGRLRYIAMPRVSKHRIFVWLKAPWSDVRLGTKKPDRRNPGAVHP
jgi:hypothetical protein